MTSTFLHFILSIIKISPQGRLAIILSFSPDVLPDVPTRPWFDSCEEVAKTPDWTAVTAFTGSWIRRFNILLEYRWLTMVLWLCTHDEIVLEICMHSVENVGFLVISLCQHDHKKQYWWWIFSNFSVKLGRLVNKAVYMYSLQVFYFMQENLLCTVPGYRYKCSSILIY